jgi:hypothetical protein
VSARRSVARALDVRCTRPWSSCSPFKGFLQRLRRDRAAEPCERRVARGGGFSARRGLPRGRLQTRRLARRGVVAPRPARTAGGPRSARGPAFDAGVGGVERRIEERTVDPAKRSLSLVHLFSPPLHPMAWKRRSRKLGGPGVRLGAAPVFVVDAFPNHLIDNMLS